MKREVKHRLEDLFSAELILRRVYLHILQGERPDIAAQMLVVMRYEEICREGEKLRRVA